MIAIELRVEGKERVGLAMAALAQHLGNDLRPALEVIRSWWHTWQSEIFASEGSAQGAAWAPLSDKYRAWKEKAYPGRPILELTGALHRAMTGGSGEWHRIGKREMTVGTKGIPYTMAHNFGTDKLPARPFLNTTNAAMRELNKAMQYLLADIKRDILRKLGGPGGMAR